MRRSVRLQVAAGATLALLLGGLPASAVTSSPEPIPDPSVTQAPLSPQATEELAPTADVDLTDLPVQATDVTGSDADLRSVSTEVTVMVTGDDGQPTVSKLRTDSSQEARALAAHLDAEPGVVAAPTKVMRALGTVNTEPLAPRQWNLNMVGAPAAWAVTQGAGVKVAVIDTGVDETHRDLVGRVLPEIDLLPAVTPLPAEKSHGTRVASLIAASINQYGMAGVAPQASILPVAALDPSGIGDSSTVARAIIAATNAGARVINLSLGGPDRDRVLDQACRYAFNHGAVVVAAGGNSFLEGNRVQYPAASPNVVAVAAEDATGNPAGFSNTGSYIDLAAPGENVLAAVPVNTFDVESGTSFAAPHVSGALALAIAANPRLTAAQLRSIITLTAQDDVSGNGWDSQLGYGTVRADRAVATARAMVTAQIRPGAKLRLRSLNAKPEPIQRGKVLSVGVRTQVRWANGSWHTNQLPTLVRFEFKATGSKKYRLAAQVPTLSNGTATMQTVAAKSGRWRAKIRQANGTWSVSNTDYVKVKTAKAKTVKAKSPKAKTVKTKKGKR